MDLLQEILQGELERLFSLADLQELVRVRLGESPQAIADDKAGKATWVRRLIAWADREGATQALADVVVALKGTAVDPRLRQQRARRIAEDLAPGTAVGPFTVVETLGSAGVSQVYRAEGPDGEVALRVLRREFAHDPVALHRYLAAQRLLAEVVHPALPAIRGVGRWEDRAYVAADFAPGRSLDVLLKDGPLPRESLRGIAAPVLGALSAIHGRGLVHGDLTTQNVIVGEGGGDRRVALVGAAADRLGGPCAVSPDEIGRLAGFGTPKCAAPEQIRGGPVDARTDVYAVGVLLYEMLTGGPPFADRTPVDVCLKHLTVDPDPPGKRYARGEIPKRWDGLVLRCLRKDPSTRYPSLEPIMAELEAAVREDREAEERRRTVRSATPEEVQDWADQFIADPEDDAVYAELEASARGAATWDTVLQAMDVVLEDASPARRRQTLFRMGRIYEMELKEVDKAEDVYRRILASDPQEELAQAALEDLLRSAGRFEPLVEILLERALQATDEAERHELFLEAAKIYEQDLGDYGRALTVVLQVHQARPADDRLLQRIERLAVLSESADIWQTLLAELGGVLGATQDPAVAVALCVRLGSWCQEHMGRPDLAVRYFQQALQIDPRSEGALLGVEAIFRAAHQWPELVQVIERLVEVASVPSVRRDRMAEAAALCEERLGAADRARELYRAVLLEDVTHARAAQALERLYTRGESWADLIELYDRRLAALTDPTARVDALLSIGELREDRLEQLEGAAEAYRGVLEIDRTNADALKGLERIYARRDQFKDLLKVLDVQLQAAVTPRQQVALLERMAGLHEEEFMDTDAAIAAFERILDTDADHPGALSALNRLYRSGKRWSQLVEILEHQAELAAEAGERLDLLKAQASVMVRHLELWGPALDILEKVAELAPKDRTVLADVVLCARKTDRFARAAAALERLAELAESGEEKGRLLVELGSLREEKLGNHEGAVDAYREALDADPGNAAAAAALRTTYLDKGDHTAAIRMLQREIEATDGNLSKAELYIKLGRVHRDRTADREQAIACFEKAVELDPASVEAAEPLAELYRETERWEDAARIYAQFSKSADALGKESAADLFLRQGEAALRLGDLARAEESLAKALELTPGRRDTHVKLAETRLKLGKHAEARTLFRDLLLRFEADMDPAERVQVYGFLADAAQGIGDFGAAAGHLDDALRLAPDDRGLCRRRAEVNEKLERWTDVVADLRRLMEGAADGERFELLVRVGDLLRERIADNDKAAKSYHAALEIEPEDRGLLHKLIKVYEATEQWSRVVEALLRIADLLDDKKMLAKYYLTAARISVGKLGRTDEGATYFDMALDNDPEVVSVFEELVRVLTDVQNWSELERAYGKMITRSDKTADSAMRANLWHSLAEIRHHRLNHLGDAIAAYETALRLDPENRPWMEVLAQLYGDDPRHAEKATRLHRQLLLINPYRAESYQLLARIHVARSRWDEAWCFCAALNSLGLAEEAEREIYQTYRDDQPLQAPEPLNEEGWRRYLHHDSLDPMITAIFSTIEPAYRKRHARTLKALGLTDKDRLDVEAKDERLTWVIAEVSRTLGMEPPPVWFQEDRPTPLVVLDADPPGLLAGTALREMAEHEMEDLKVVAFLVGRHLGYLRSGCHMRSALQSGTALSTWFLAALRRIIDAVPVPQGMVQPVTDAVEVIKRHVDGPATEKLEQQVLAFMEGAAGGSMDLKRWGQAVDLTADRAGFLVCNDVDFASKTIKSSPAESWMAPVKDRLREIILYAVGDTYFSLRERLGVRIVVEDR
jgi:tetratricopeptide (TPR) repeat protein